MKKEKLFCLDIHEKKFLDKFKKVYQLINGKKITTTEIYLHGLYSRYNNIKIPVIDKCKYVYKINSCSNFDRQNMLKIKMCSVFLTDEDLKILWYITPKLYIHQRNLYYGICYLLSIDEKIKREFLREV